MYKPSGNETFNVIADIPLPSGGNPTPSLVADDQQLTLSYTTNKEGASRATVRFTRALIHVFGTPNDEVFSSHPLYGLGLEPYAVVEVMNSGWIVELEVANSVHPMHNPENFKSLHHYIFAFKDSTFECIAIGIELVRD